MRLGYYGNRYIWLFKMSIHFSSLTDDWKTPQSVYDKLNDEFKFDYDPCPLYGNDNAGPLFAPGKDGLDADWGKSTFVNPPYSKLKEWIRKAYEEHLKGKTVVMLIPSRTDTAAWHDYVMKAKEIRFIRGRLKFGDAKYSAPFPSAVVIFDNATKGLGEKE